jgi:hypothetical protein
MLARESPRVGQRTEDSGCPKVAEEGNAIRIRHKAYATGTRRLLRVLGDASFARSFDPYTSILTTHRGASLGGEATDRHHGWASPREREEPSLGSVRTDVARLAACHRFRKEGSVTRREKEGDRGLRPCEDQELGSGCSHVVVVAEIGRRRLVSNTLGTALQKERPGPSERGPSSERESAGETVGRRIERNVCRESGSPLRRARIGARLRVARDRHPAVHPSSNVVCGSWDRGCKGHRIL